MEWTVQEVAKSAGVTPRTLRHYDDIGLLPPARIGDNGYRYYDLTSVARLQRILLLRDLGLTLPTVAEVLARETDEEAALRTHIALLEAERDRLDQRIKAVHHTLESTRVGADPAMSILLEGFNDPYREEVISRWGEEAFEASNTWWHSKSLQEQLAWKRTTDQLVTDWITTWKTGDLPSSPPAQAMAARHIEWLTQIPGTPLADGNHDQSMAMIRGIAQTFVDDPNYADLYGGPLGAVYVRDALLKYVRIRSTPGQSEEPTSR
ncbi:MerR family transcriptional regulator [Nocardia sp. NPDC051030]|uniref:MerR family transcriptional regulator n=1 Tax=Nocardia sp. NPDC051030 TaxID=3155162 RepID=UPI00341C04D9